MKDIKSNPEESEDLQEGLNITGDTLEKSITNKINLLSTSEINTFIKNLSKPQFLGSIHLSKENNPNYRSIDELLKGQLELKLSKSLKNPFLNPITRYLIYVMILFNLLWLLFFYIL